MAWPSNWLSLWSNTWSGLSSLYWEMIGVWHYHGWPVGDLDGVSVYARWKQKTYSQKDLIRFDVALSSNQYQVGARAGFIFCVNGNTTSFYRLEREFVHWPSYEIKINLYKCSYSEGAWTNTLLGQEVVYGAGLLWGPLLAYIDGTTIYCFDDVSDAYDGIPLFTVDEGGSLLTGEYIGLFSHPKIHDGGHSGQIEWGVVWGSRLDVIGGTGTGTYEADEEKSIYAPPSLSGPLRLFEEWTGDTEHVDNPLNNSATVTMPPRDNVTLTATYVPGYYLTVNNGSGSGWHKENAEVEVVADTKSGRRFMEWTGDVEYLDDPTAATATVTMPAADIEITATYSIGSQKVHPEFFTETDEVLAVQGHESLPDGLTTNQFGHIVNDGRHYVRDLPDGGKLFGILDGEGGYGNAYGCAFGIGGT